MVSLTADSTHHPLDKIEVWCRNSARRLAFVGVLGMLLAAGITVVDVLARWAFNYSVPGLNEIVEVIVAIAVTACIPCGLATGVNLKIDILARWITGRLAAWLDAVGAVLLLAFFAILAWQVYIRSGVVAGNGRTTTYLGMPLAPVLYVAAALLGVGVAVQTLMAANAMRKAWTSPADGTVITPLTLVVIGGMFVVACLAAYGVYDFTTVSVWVKTHTGSAMATAFILMWVMLLFQVPLAPVTGLVGIFGLVFLIGVKPALVTFSTESTTFLLNPQVATLPLFLMMGSLAAVAQLSEDLYRFAYVLLGGFRGGLGLATVGGCAGFGMLSGSSLATAATIGRVALPEMRRRGYSPAFSTGCCAAENARTLGRALVPPRLRPNHRVFALLTEASIGQLLVATIGPAILAVLLYFVTIVLYLRIAPGAAPERRIGRDPGELRQTFIKCLPTFGLLGVMIGGLYSGAFTVTECASVGAVGAFVLALCRGKLNRGALLNVMAQTTATTAMIYGLIFGSLIFSYFIGASSFPDILSDAIKGLGWPSSAIMLLMLIGYLCLGSLMESYAVMLITVPIITPIILGMGYDLAWWGVIMLCVVETGLIHPPLGLNVFVLKSLAPDVPMWTIYKGVFPFVAADLVKLALLVVFPSITLWLVWNMQR